RANAPSKVGHRDASRSRASPGRRGNSSDTRWEHGDELGPTIREGAGEAREQSVPRGRESSFGARNPRGGAGWEHVGELATACERGPCELEAREQIGRASCRERV